MHFIMMTLEFQKIIWNYMAFIMMKFGEKIPALAHVRYSSVSFPISIEARERLQYLSSARVSQNQEFGGNLTT